MKERHRIKIADLEGNFIYMNIRKPLAEVEALIALINGPTSCAASYERKLPDQDG